MSSLSEIVRAFVIDSFQDDRSGKAAEFTSLFKKPQEKTRNDEHAGQPVVESTSIEDQTRKIFEDAFAQGEKAGHEMGMKKVEHVVKRLDACLAELAGFRDTLIEEAKRFSVEMALAFAEALVLKECSEKREVVLDMARRAFEICEDKYDLIVRMRREDAARLSTDMLTHLKVVPDDSIKEPGFIVETNFGDIDGRISTQLDELRREFLND
ncbi:MAG: flagellar assembly protein H [Syntrophorhabdus sp. PtaU1.Bin153]|nr:MAG: flagellar assembly protein H [Syntrophorhabdus sp. PtaU1.Bin153]